MIAIAAIVSLTCANVLGAQVGAAVSGVTTLVKVTALAAIILGAFLLGDGNLSHLTEGGVVQGGGLARPAAAALWTHPRRSARKRLAAAPRAPPPPRTL